jgi:restriction endonuclease Mrr
VSGLFCLSFFIKARRINNNDIVGGDNMEHLASAILLQTMKDWENSKERTEIQGFLESRWFETLAELTELDPVKIRVQVITGNYQRKILRAAYR